MRCITGSGSGSRWIKVWNYHTGECLHTTDSSLGDSDYKNAIWPLPGNTVAIGGADITLYNYDTMKKIRSFSSHTSPIISISYQGGVLLTGSRDKRVKIWNFHVEQEYFMRLFFSQLGLQGDFSGFLSLSELDDAQTQEIKYSAKYQHVIDYIQEKLNLQKLLGT